MFKVDSFNQEMDNEFNLSPGGHARLSVRQDGAQSYTVALHIQDRHQHFAVTETSAEPALLVRLVANVVDQAKRKLYAHKDRTISRRKRAKNRRRTEDTFERAAGHSDEG